MVHIGVGQHRAGDRRMPTVVPGMKRCGLIDLLAKIGRRIQQEPVLTIGGNRQRGLRGHNRVTVPGARGAANIAVAVPLRKSAASGGTQHYDPKHRSSLRRGRAPQLIEKRLVGAGVAVDLQAHGDLNDLRLCPDAHWFSSRHNT